ncbi:DUF2760 [Desulfonema magnum]|uniref:DUF2760 n=2 Tax=Desulfonema magnum TaxID=45655 RepID=A0A975BQZ7_9BACT|nr:DUF2760 [Desulfonema magnum]
MDIIRLYSRRSLFWIIFFTSMLCIAIDSACHFALNISSQKIVLFLSQANTVSSETGEFIRQASTIIDMLKLYFVPVSTGFFFLFGLLLWLFLRYSFVKLMEKSYLISAKAKKKSETTAKETNSDKQEKIQNDRRLFLHLLSVFQKEGRLLDFFSEDLEDYEDDQIGAAVRSVHESCKKVMSKYLTSGAVLDEDEDDEIMIQPGFDPTAIKLIGNVTGEPPFKGVVHHRGWKVTRLELPTLSASRNPDIIAPAEVEIL